MTLAIKNVSKHFGGIGALDQCTLTVEQGKITAIIGPNGSGKSTLFNVVSRLVQEEEGTITLEQQDITAQRDYQVARGGISRTFQEARLFRNLTIQDHLEIAFRQDDEKLFHSIFHRRTNHDGEIKKILQLVHLDLPLQTYATELSYGQRKLLDLAMTITKPHSLLLLDEPVAGVNPQLRQDIQQILRSLNEKGETILLIEHDMNFVMDLADHIFVLDNGKVIAQGVPKEIRHNPKVMEAYLGD